MDSIIFSRLLKNSVIAGLVRADAKNCSTLMNQSGSVDEAEGEAVVGLPLRSGD